MRLYLCVTRDRYELPVAVADSAKELAAMVGIRNTTINESLSRVRAGDRKWSQYKEVEVDDD